MAADLQTCFLAEVFAAYKCAEDQRADADRVRAAIEALDRIDGPVRYLESIFIRGEEAVIHLFEADDCAAVERVLEEAGLEAERISRAYVLAGEAEHGWQGSPPDRVRNGARPPLGETSGVAGAQRR